MRLICAGTIAGLAAAAGVACAQPSFSGLGDAAGGPFVSEAMGLTPDGLKVVGYVTPASGSSLGAVWGTGGLETLTDSAAVPLAVANCIAADGVTVAGEGTGPDGQRQGVRWVLGPTPGPVFLGGTALGGIFGSSVQGVSADGQRLVGSYEPEAFRLEACIWDGTTRQGLGHLIVDGDFSVANGCTPDGQIVVGASDADVGSVGFRWRAGDGMKALPDLAGGATNAEALAISGDGTTIVGYGTGAGGTVAVKWIRSAEWSGNDAVSDLGDLPGGPTLSVARAVSADGSRIVGYGSPAFGLTEAVMWDASGLRRLSDVFVQEYGLNITGWQLRQATGISADGLVITGWGTNPQGEREAWVANLRPQEPSPCPPCAADFNRDDGVDDIDITDFFAAFEQGEPCADVDQSDGIDDLDITAFFQAFEQGC